MRHAIIILASAVVASTPAAAQDDRPTRVRVGVGPQFSPGFPGSEEMRLRPLLTVARAKGDDPFAFGAPGDGPSIAISDNGTFAFGPAFRFEGKRNSEDAGGGLTRVGRTVELGGFAALWATDWLRLRGDVRKGIGGHKGVVGTIGADYVARDGDRWLWSLGPRATLADGRRERAYFGVDAATNARTGLPLYRPRGGLESVGAAGRVTYSFTPTWGIHGQAQYARLIRDAGDSPIVRRVDSQDQWTVGAALTYTFFIR